MCRNSIGVPKTFQLNLKVNKAAARTQVIKLAFFGIIVQCRRDLENHGRSVVYLVATLQHAANKADYTNSIMPVTRLSFWMSFS